MKSISYLILMIICTNTIPTWAKSEETIHIYQNYQQTNPDTTVYMVVQVHPKFPGGSQALSRFINASSKYPVSSLKTKTSKMLVFKLLIEKDGFISDVTTIKSEVKPEIETEAKRMIRSKPNWVPGSQNGRLLRVYSIMPLHFNVD